MRQALAEARAGAARGNLAVGAIVLRNGAIIARGLNEVARGCEWRQRIAPESREGRCQGRPWPNQLGLRRVWAACHRSSVTIAGTAR
jgi:deoxycytidylate deaminase